MTARAVTPDEIELLRDALGAAASFAETRARHMAPGTGGHHSQRAAAMRTLCAKLHDHGCLLTDDDTLLLNVTGLNDAERADIVADVRGRQARDAAYDPPEQGWTCFHCGETFRSVWGARRHFGTPAEQRPLCVGDPAAADRARRLSP